MEILNSIKKNIINFLFGWISAFSYGVLLFLIIFCWDRTENIALVIAIFFLGSYYHQRSIDKLMDCLKFSMNYSNSKKSIETQNLFFIGSFLLFLSSILYSIIKSISRKSAEEIEYLTRKINEYERKINEYENFEGSDSDSDDEQEDSEEEN